MDPTTMDLTQIRDWAARRQGWHYEPPQVDGFGEQREYWRKWTISSSHGGRTYAYSHPIPPTLDAIAGLMPEPWRYTTTVHIGNSNTVATSFFGDTSIRAMGGTEILARARLAMLATLAEDKEKAQ